MAYKIMSKIDFMNQFPIYQGSKEMVKWGDKVIIGFASGETNYGTVEEILYDSIPDEISFKIPDVVTDIADIDRIVQYQASQMQLIIVVKCFGSEKLRKPHLKNIIKIDERFLNNEQI